LTGEATKKQINMELKFVTDRVIKIDSDTLESLSFNDFDLHRVILEELRMDNSTFVNANLRGSFLWKSSFIDCNFKFANLIMADLRESILIRANLSSCKLNNALLDNTDLSNACLENADVSGTSFVNSKMLGANMDCKNIDEANLKGSVFNDQTIWPINFDPLKKGALYTP